MSYSNLDIVAFDLGTGHYVALLKMIDLQADNDLVDAAGIKERYEYNLAVKQGQKADFTVHVLNTATTPVPSSNLDVSLWSIGGTDWIADLRSGTISVTNKSKEASSLASAYKKPGLLQTAVEISTDKLISSSATLFDSLLTGASSAFNVDVQIGFAGQTLHLPMILKAGSIHEERGDYAMEKVTLAMQGTPSGGGSGLLALALTGSGSVGLSLNTGFKTYSTASGQVGVLTKLTTTMNDGALIEQSGTLEIVGALGAA